MTNIKDKIALAIVEELCNQCQSKRPNAPYFNVLDNEMIVIDGYVDMKKFVAAIAKAVK